MTPEAKIWTILNEIDNVLAIAPSGESVSVDAKELEKSIKREEHGQIIEKLAKDLKLLEIQEKPDYKKSFWYRLKINDTEEFRRALNDAHIKHFGSLEMLTGDNLFSVVDVAADIMNGLQMTMTNKTMIPLLPPIVRFSSLMPADGINLRDRYCEFRWKALGYMKNNEHIEDFVLNRDSAFHRWQQTITITVDRTKFTKFYENLIKVYKKRVRFPNKEEESKTAATIPEPPIQKVEIVGGKIKTEVEGLEKGLEAIATKNEDTTITRGKKRIRLPHFPSTPWKDVTIRFFDKQNVFIEGGKKKVPADCESLGFLDGKSNKPNSAWEWLLEVGKNNSESEEYQSPIPDIIKQRKRQVSDFLQRLFKNDTDPFETVETNLRKIKYRAKIILVPPQSDGNNENGEDKLGIKEYLKETMTSKYESPKNDWHSL